MSYEIESYNKQIGKFADELVLKNKPRSMDHRIYIQLGFTGILKIYVLKRNVII